MARCTVVRDGRRPRQWLDWRLLSVEMIGLCGHDEKAGGRWINCGERTDQESAFNHIGMLHKTEFRQCSNRNREGFPCRCPTCRGLQTEPDEQVFMHHDCTYQAYS